MIDTAEQDSRRAAARERFTAENATAATRLRTLIAPFSAARAAHETALRAAAAEVVTERESVSDNWGTVESLAEQRIPPAVRDEVALITERVDTRARELAETVTHGLIAGAWQEGDAVWTPDSIQSTEPLIVAQVANADRPTAFEYDGAGQVIAATYDLSTVVLTGDGHRVGREQHIPPWDDEHDRPDEEPYTEVPYEVWGGSGFQRSGTCHPTTRGWVKAGRLG